mmetsp:Transcript_7438/g.10464  ORF Transcript_7438/g.10464 Transcript_7438/m.10464 type:complete len:240 (-) Transcript_7438:396-1115(-)
MMHSSDKFRNILAAVKSSSVAFSRALDPKFSCRGITVRIIVFARPSFIPASSRSFKRSSSSVSPSISIPSISLASSFLSPFWTKRILTCFGVNDFQDSRIGGVSLLLSSTGERVINVVLIPTEDFESAVISAFFSLEFPLSCVCKLLLLNDLSMFSLSVLPFISFSIDGISSFFVIIFFSGSSLIFVFVSGTAEVESFEDSFFDSSAPPFQNFFALILFLLGPFLSIDFFELLFVNGTC